MKCTFLALTYSILFCLHLKSQSNKNLPKIHLEVKINDLYSTHSDHFWGGGIAVSKNITENKVVGIGLDHIYSNNHNDNGWNLTNLHFTPIYFKYQYSCRITKILKIVLFTDQGISINSYKKYDPSIIPNTKKINESGFYSEIGMMTSKFYFHHSYVYFGIGLKNLKLSTNELDVNPHGISFQANLSLN
jgi:hypothetical protein